MEKRLGPRADLDAVEWRKTSYFCRESNPNGPARNLSLYRLIYPGSYSNLGPLKYEAGGLLLLDRGIGSNT
jgi:hypothetical protein